ncbi:MAG: hypothetical protein ABSA83_11405 [Verrucomicrobiota bacterium]|jgi:hypothetical protein
MSTGRDEVFGGNGRKTARCVVVSIYEDLGGRELLLDLCDSLARTFKEELKFRFDWWRFKYLADPEIAMEAALSAVRADLILLAVQSSALPDHVEKWFEGWLPNRVAGDGALVLVQPSREGASSFFLPSSLRLTAKRARLDYLRLSSPGSPTGAPEMPPLQPYINRLLADGEQPLHWGINE